MILDDWKHLKKHRWRLFFKIDFHDPLISRAKDCYDKSKKARWLDLGEHSVEDIICELWKAGRRANNVKQMCCKRSNSHLHRPSIRFELSFLLFILFICYFELWWSTYALLIMFLVCFACICCLLIFLSQDCMFRSLFCFYDLGLYWEQCKV